MQRTAIAWLVLDLTGSPVALGTVLALQLAPYFAVSLVSGALADRLPTRLLLTAAQASMAANGLILGAVTLTGAIELWHVYALALWSGVAHAFEVSSRQMFMAAILPRALLPSAVGLSWTMGYVGEMAGAAGGGIVIAAWGTGWCFAVFGSAFLLSIAVQRRIVLRSRPEPLATGALWHDIAAGLRFVGRRPDLLMALVVLSVAASFGDNLKVALPLLARYELGLGAVGFGVLDAATKGGACLGGIVAATRPFATRRGLIASALVPPAILVALAGVPHAAAAFVLLSFHGLAMTLYGAGTNAALHRWTDDEYRGRVVGIYMLVLGGMPALGGVITGALAAGIGIRATLALLGVACAVGIVLAAAAARRASRSTMLAGVPGR